MTQSQAIQSAYNWAWNTQNDKKSPVMSLLCAKQVLEAIELYGDSPACHEVLSNLLKEWEAAKRASFSEPIKILRNCLSTIVQRQPVSAQ